MPHLILECSKNVASSIDGRCTLLGLYAMLADTGLFKIEDIKGRMIEHEVFRAGRDLGRAVGRVDGPVGVGRGLDRRRTTASESFSICDTDFRASLLGPKCPPDEPHLIFSPAMGI